MLNPHWVLTEKKQIPKIKLRGKKEKQVRVQKTNNSRMQLPSELVPEHPKFNKIEKSYYTCLYAPYLLLYE